MLPVSIDRPTSLWVRRELGDLWHWTDRLFDELWSAVARPVPGGPEWSPAARVVERPEELRVALQVPGIAADELHVAVEGDTLVVAGEKRLERGDRTDGLVWSERRYGRFEQRFALPPDADRDRIRARHENGELTVVVPRTGPHRSRRIPVRGGAVRERFGGLRRWLRRRFERR